MLCQERLANQIFMTKNLLTDDFQLSPQILQQQFGVLTQGGKQKKLINCYCQLHILYKWLYYFPGRSTAIFYIPHMYLRHRSSSSTVLGVYARLFRSHSVYEKWWSWSWWCAVVIVRRRAGGRLNALLSYQVVDLVDRTLVGLHVSRRTRYSILSHFQPALDDHLSFGLRHTTSFWKNWHHDMSLSDGLGEWQQLSGFHSTQVRDIIKISHHW